jgi:hypothetical protein
MPKKLTTEIFIEKAIKKHGAGTFGYSNAVYTKNDEDIIITCHTHGNFVIKPYMHLYGRGCQKCGMEKCVPKQILTEDFINKAKLKFGETLIFDKTIYDKSGKDIIVTCPVHGDFTTTPTKLMNTKNGCNQCAIEIVAKTHRYTQEEYFNIIFDVHGDYYDYSLSNYTTSSNKIKIICPIHGVFEQKARQHLTGSGCQVCGKEQLMGFKRSKFIEKYTNKPCIFYTLKLFNEDEEFIKVGITGRSIKERFSDGLPYKYEILSMVEDSPDIIWDLELSTKRQLTEYNYVPKIQFFGYTECFTLEGLNYFLK